MYCPCTAIKWKDNTFNATPNRTSKCSHCVLFPFYSASQLFLNSHSAPQVYSSTLWTRVVCVIWEEFQGRGFAASICAIRGGSLISVAEAPRTHPPTLHSRDGQREYCKMGIKEGAITFQHRAVLMVQSVYEGWRISVGVFLGYWLVAENSLLLTKQSELNSGWKMELRDIHSKMVVSFYCYSFFLYFNFASHTLKSAD